MTCRLVRHMVLPACLIALATAPVLAQQPSPAAPPATATAQPAPAAPAPAQPTPTTPAPSGATPSGAAPATPTPTTSAPAAPAPAATAPAPADPFGETVTLTAKPVVVLKGNANWDTAFETLTGAIKKLTADLAKQGITPAGMAIVVYTSTDDTGFSFDAQIPVTEAPDSLVKKLGKDITLGKSPEGKALKFVHRGSYDAMDNTYEAITNHLDEKKLEAQDMFIEEYVTDPLKTAEDKLVINVYVPLK